MVAQMRGNRAPIVRPNGLVDTVRSKVKLIRMKTPKGERDRNHPLRDEISAFPETRDRPFVPSAAEVLPDNFRNV